MPVIALEKINFKSGDLMTEDRLRLLDENYNKLVDAVNNLTITQSTDGREVELTNDGQFIKWRYRNLNLAPNEGWTILLDLTDIRGDKGKSAYQLYLDSLLPGTPALTELEWVRSLQGKDGVTQDLTDYYTSKEVDSKIAPLENKPQTYVSLTEPLGMKNGDFWIKSNP